jgi:hypothetical protein
MKYMVIYDALKINKIAYFEIIIIKIWDVFDVCVHK